MPLLLLRSDRPMVDTEMLQGWVSRAFEDDAAVVFWHEAAWQPRGFYSSDLEISVGTADGIRQWQTFAAEVSAGKHMPPRRLLEPVVSGGCTAFGLVVDPVADADSGEGPFDVLLFALAGTEEEGHVYLFRNESDRDLAFAIIRGHSSFKRPTTNVPITGPPRRGVPRCRCTSGTSHDLETGCLNQGTIGEPGSVYCSACAGGQCNCPCSGCVGVEEPNDSD